MNQDTMARMEGLMAVHTRTQEIHRALLALVEQRATLEEELRGLERQAQALLGASSGDTPPPPVPVVTATPVVATTAAPCTTEPERPADEGFTAILPPPSRMVHERAQLMIQCLEQMGGSGTRSDLLARMKQVDPSITRDKIVYALRMSGRFTRDARGRWRVGRTEVELSEERRRMWRRYNAIREIIEDCGGQAGWTEILREAQRRLGPQMTRNRMNYALRNGPFHRVPRAGWRWVGGEVCTELMHLGSWCRVVARELDARREKARVRLCRPDGVELIAEVAVPVPERDIRYTPLDARVGLLVD